MSRQIKFRAWDESQKRMFENVAVLGNGRMLITTKKEYLGVDKDVVLMQYTDLKDKNGKEIYEGDVVKRGNEIKVIEWKKSYASLGWNIVNGEAYEIIGNIYENKDLI